MDDLLKRLQPLEAREAKRQSRTRRTLRAVLLPLLIITPIAALALPTRNIFSAGGTIGAGDVNQNFETLWTELETLRPELETLQIDLEDLRPELQTLQGKVDVLRTDNDALQGALDQLQDRESSLRAQHLELLSVLGVEETTVGLAPSTLLARLQDQAATQVLHSVNRDTVATDVFQGNFDACFAGSPKSCAAIAKRACVAAGFQSGFLEGEHGPAAVSVLCTSRAE